VADNELANLEPLDRRCHLRHDARPLVPQDQRVLNREVLVGVSREQLEVRTADPHELRDYGQVSRPGHGRRTLLAG
jgi:hypothetical protein